MKVAIERVRDGKVIVDGEPFAEGSTVLRAMVQAERGAVVSWEDLGERLR